MWCSLKTFKLSKIFSVHIFYLILIVTFVNGVEINPIEKEDDEKNISEKEDKAHEPPFYGYNVSGILERMKKMYEKKNVQSKNNQTTPPNDGINENEKTEFETQIEQKKNKTYGPNPYDLIQRINKFYENDNIQPENNQITPPNDGINEDEKTESEKLLETDDFLKDPTSAQEQEQEKIFELIEEDDGADEEEPLSSLLKYSEYHDPNYELTNTDDQEIKPHNEVTPIDDDGVENINKKKQKKKKKKKKKKKQNNNDQENNIIINSDDNGKNQGSSVTIHEDNETSGDEETTITTVQEKNNIDEEGTHQTKSVSIQEENVHEGQGTDTYNNAQKIENELNQITVNEKIDDGKVSNKINKTESQTKKNKKKKNKGARVKKPTEARVFCTFRGDVEKMYQRVQKRFEGYFCHAIVFGTPLIIRHNDVFVDNNLKHQLKKIHTYNNNTLLISIIKHESYEKWSVALDNIKNEVKMIMRFVDEYHIDGIQFSNLQPTASDQLDTDMLCKIVKFFHALRKKALKRKLKLEIGITIESYSQSLTTSFESFETLNKIVSWYSIHTISMVRCSAAHTSGTSPLKGEVSLENTITTLMNTDIDKNKIVIGIQLYPNKFGKLEPSTYIEMCLDKKPWDDWCAASPMHFREKSKLPSSQNEYKGSKTRWS